jgi:polysaccharide export outer membrane protein
MNKSKIVFLSLLGLIFFNSCVSNKKFILMQNAKTSSSNDSLKSNYLLNRTLEYKLQVNDILLISLVSTDEMATKAFSHNAAGGQQVMQGGGGIGNMLYITGYSINQLGEIDLPVLGKTNVNGLTVTEAKEKIEIELKKYFKVFHLVVKLTEMPFTVIGEVNNPGRFSGLVNQVTLFEALALASDLTPIANRKNVTLIRQNPDGVKVYKIDFTQADLINTPYYILRPNDVIYVEPLKSRSIGDFSSFRNSLSTITPLLSTLILALNTYIIITR